MSVAGPSRSYAAPMRTRTLTPDDAAGFAALRLLGLERHPEAFATSAEDWRAAPLSSRAWRTCASS